MDSMKLRKENNLSLPELIEMLSLAITLETLAAI